MRLTDFNMVGVMVTCLYILITLNMISTAEVNERSTEGSRKRTAADPVSHFFSELGDLFLDVDRSLSVQTAPKVEYEDGLVAEIFRPSNEYFGNVQKSYRSLQKKLGALVRESVGPKRIYGDQDLSTVKPPNSEEIEKNLASTQASDIKTGTLKQTKKNVKNAQQSSGKVDDEISNNECSSDILNNPFLDSYTREKCSQRLKRHVDTDDRVKRSRERLMLESRRKNQLVIPFDLEEFDTFPYRFQRREGDVAESDSKSEGRIIGDVMYSESLFDRNIRQLLRDHGKWILDNPFLSRWRKSSTADSKDSRDVTTEGLATETEPTAEESSASEELDVESTQAYIPVTTEYNTEIPASENIYPEIQQPQRSANYYRILDSGETNEEEVDIVLNPESDLRTDRDMNTVEEFEEDLKLEESDSKETVILAFTPEGVPLKLRLGAEIENPVKFLHRVLKSAGVSLNVPVESYDNIEPVGKEVLKFGAGVSTRTIDFDLSNTDELKTLLKSLMKSRTSGKPKF